MKRIIPFLGLLIALLVTSVAYAQPDLIVTNISVAPSSPQAGDSVMIAATIENVGTMDANNNFRVRFSVDGNRIEDETVALGIDAGHSRTVSVQWTATVGTHAIAVEADHPFDKISESSEGNNTSTRTIVVPIPTSSSNLSELKVAVARFEDESGSGFMNVGQGIADELIEKLVDSGIRVLERSELEAVMQERGLNPALTSELAAAGQILGADLLIIGSVTEVNVEEASLNLGFLSLSSASVNVDMSARLVSVYTSEILSTAHGNATEEGATGFSVDIGKIVSLSQPLSSNVCTGGLSTNKPFYQTGETAHIGYLNPAAPSWYGVEIYTNTGTFVKWLGWQFIASGGCGDWFWNQLNASNVQMPPGVYTAKLWNGMTYVALTTFQIQPGGVSGLPLVGEITVGTSQFNETIVGKATNSALNGLVADMIGGMEQVAPEVLATKQAVASAESTSSSSLPQQASNEGQLAAILPDGRIAINIGSSGGVTKGDFFEVLNTANLITDPATGEVLAYDILGVKGEIVITEVRTKVSYAIKTSEFSPQVGDIVRSSP